MNKPKAPLTKGRKEDWITYANALKLQQTELFLRATNRANIKRACDAIQALYTGGACRLAADERDLVFNILLKWEMRLMGDDDKDL